MCANPALPHASEACCDPYDDPSVTNVGRNYFYDGERMTYATAETRCESHCVYKDMDGGISRNRRHTGYHWVDSPCNILAKINNEGYVAIVHDLEAGYIRLGNDDIPLHVSDESLNYFKVYWSGEYPTKKSNSCGSCQVLTDGCLCQTSVTDSPVFTAMSDIASPDDIVSSLTVGFVDPTSFDDATFIIEEGAGFTAYMYIKEPGSLGEYDENTVFKVTDSVGRTLYLRNVQSTVSLQGYTASYTPTVILAEDASNYTDVVFKNATSRTTGSLYADMGMTSDQFIEWQVNVDAPVVVKVKFRYALDAQNRPVAITVNGAVVDTSFDMLPTSGWDHWRYSSPIEISLAAGMNTIKLSVGDYPDDLGLTVPFIYATKGDSYNGLGNLTQCEADCDKE